MRKRECYSYPSKCDDICLRTVCCRDRESSFFPLFSPPLTALGISWASNKHSYLWEAVSDASCAPFRILQPRLPFQPPLQPPVQGRVQPIWLRSNLSPFVPLIACLAWSFSAALSYGTPTEPCPTLASVRVQRRRTIRRLYRYFHLLQGFDSCLKHVCVSPWLPPSFLGLQWHVG